MSLLWINLGRNRVEQHLDYGLPLTTNNNVYRHSL